MGEGYTKAVWEARESEEEQAGIARRQAGKGMNLDRRPGEATGLGFLLPVRCF